MKNAKYYLEDTTYYFKSSILYVNNTRLKVRPPNVIVQIVAYGFKVKVKTLNNAAVCPFSPEALGSNLMNIHIIVIQLVYHN